jgi:hypothetical protein
MKDELSTQIAEIARGGKVTKAMRRLAGRRVNYDEHGKNPRMGHNPSNGSGEGHDMHRPGSMKK